MLIDRAWIAAHIPHSGSMCLLEEVLDWDAARARCRSRAHQSTHHPLRAHGRLSVVCGIEVAAQTMAVHGALVATVPDRRPRVGYLASLRGVVLHVDRLDNINGDLIAAVERVAGNESSVVYQFAVSSESRTLVSGRATIVLNPAGMIVGRKPVSP